jgi:hypothetical protein
VATAVISDTVKIAEHPDLSWIRAHVPILEVASLLGFDVRGNRATCWRTSNHANGDADPSLRFHPRKNRARCFVCDMKYGHSNIDLVMAVKHCDCATAVRWIAERFAVPCKKAGRPIGSKKTQIPTLRTGYNGGMEVVVRSGVYGQLDPSAKAILTLLFNFRDPDTGFTQISYRGIAVYSGVESSATVSKALKFLQKIHAIQILRGPRLGITRPCNQYRVTLDDEKFLALCNETYRALRESSEKEKAIRSEKRLARETESQLEGSVSEVHATRKCNPVDLSGVEPKRHPQSFRIESCCESQALNRKPQSLLMAGGSAPRTPRTYSFQDGNQDQHHSCKGLNLSSVIEVNSDLTLHSVKRAIEFIAKQKEL